jgi:hypothetical protein
MNQDGYFTIKFQAVQEDGSPHTDWRRQGQVQSLKYAKVNPYREPAIYPCWKHPWRPRLTAEGLRLVMKRLRAQFSYLYQPAAPSPSFQFGTDRQTGRQGSSCNLKRGGID